MTTATANVSFRMTKASMTARTRMRMSAPIPDATEINAEQLDSALRTQLNGIRTALEGEGWTIVSADIGPVRIRHGGDEPSA